MSRSCVRCGCCRRTAPSAPHTRPTQRLSRPPPIQKLGAENHMPQLNVWCSWWWAYVPETCRAKNTLIKLPCCIKLAFQIIPLILIRDNRWEWVTSFTNPATLSPRKDNRYPFDRMLRQQVAAKRCGTCLPNYTAWLGVSCVPTAYLAEGHNTCRVATYLPNTYSRIRRGLVLKVGRSVDKIL